MAQFSVHMRPKSDRINHIKPECTVHSVYVCRHCLRSKKTKERRV